MKNYYLTHKKAAVLSLNKILLILGQMKKYLLNFHFSCLIQNYEMKQIFMRIRFFFAIKKKKKFFFFDCPRMVHFTLLLLYTHFYCIGIKWKWSAVYCNKLQTGVCNMQQICFSKSQEVLDISNKQFWQKE